jgi:hypothetical protein
MPRGFPLRTTKTTVDVYGAELLGRRACHPALMRPEFWAMASMS